MPADEPDRRDPFEQEPPAVSPDPYRKPEDKPHREREGYEKVALWWRTLFPICAFSIGGLLLVYQGIFAAHASPTIIGVGLVLAGLGPAGLIDVIRKIP